MKKYSNQLYVIAFYLVPVVAFMAGCVTGKVSTVTQASDGTFSTNTVTVINTNNLTLDCAVLQQVVAGTVAIVVQKDPGAVEPLRDTATALDGVLHGQSAKTTEQLLDLLTHNQPSSVLAENIAPLISIVSAFEQNLLKDPRYGASVAGQITQAVASAVLQGITLGLAGH